MQHRFPHASLAPSGFAVDSVKVIADSVQNGCDHAIPQERARTADGPAGGFKVDMYGPLTCPSVAAEWS
ncbi:hypothetical protein GGD54_001139 [Rhizobium tropici]|uniref:Uncharacterized protein n=1 Tax=Rhizobium tropici TaxID=398 RepID=A0ABR6QWA5_RHITR|nr:hypothetical protein [Rhizobium tropici]MBB5592166.1 hypothetical protein [Rhizobium tropici]MBB6491220.1 hypothetical protein [Rhizobium tropici]